MAIPTLIVPTLYHYDLLENMLRSIDHPVDQIIVIDNGGNLKQCSCPNAQQINIVSLPTNIGVAASWNLGIKLTPFSEWWLIANDDIIWNPGKLSAFEKFMQKNSIVADWRPLTAFSGFAIHETTIEKVGLFDEFYYPACGEETNYWTRANRASIIGIDIPDAFSLQDSTGRTRAEMQHRYPRTAGIIADNLAVGIASQGQVVGWNLDKRRKSDPTVRYGLSPIADKNPEANQESL